MDQITITISKSALRLALRVTLGRINMLNRLGGHGDMALSRVEAELAQIQKTLRVEEE